MDIIKFPSIHAGFEIIAVLSFVFHFFNLPVRRRILKFVLWRLEFTTHGDFFQKNTRFFQSPHSNCRPKKRQVNINIERQFKPSKMHIMSRKALKESFTVLGDLEICSKNEKIPKNNNKISCTLRWFVLGGLRKFANSGNITLTDRLKKTIKKNNKSKFFVSHGGHCNASNGKCQYFNVYLYKYCVYFCVSPKAAAIFNPSKNVYFWRFLDT